MASRLRTRFDPPESPELPDAPVETTGRQTRTVPMDRVLGLLGDEYTRRVLGAVVEEPRTVSEVVGAADVSKATVYRRLGELQEAGLVETTLRVDADGHHCKRFHAVVERIAVEFRDGDYDASVQVRTEESTPGAGGPATDWYAGADD